MKLIDYELTSNGQGANRYGFTSDLKKKFGINSYYKPLADWDHGWTYVQTPHIDYFKVQLSKKLNFVVSNYEKANNIKKYTRNKVYLAPLPFYFYYNNSLCPSNQVDKKDKLLVMPAKTLNFAELNKKNFLHFQKEFIKNILDFKNEFREIVICVHSNDFSEWKNIIGKNKIKIIGGANPLDINSYKRMYQIFSNFEYMTTNFFGSHIVYAACMGIKVSLNSELIDYKINESKIINHYSKLNKLEIKEVINDYYNLFNTKNIKNKLLFLFHNNPKKAKNKSLWAKKEIGENYKIDLLNAKNYLGLNFIDQLNFGIKKLF